MENNQKREMKTFLLLTESLELEQVEGLSTYDPERWYVQKYGTTCTIGCDIFHVDCDRQVIRDNADAKFKLLEERYLSRKRNLAKL
ncbi:MAG: hypothetical protein CTY12_06270 [Methylotenera sp.]|nr:MAG: hypothetical protein CTY12_06270 [Methylotenera sp.]